MKSDLKRSLRSGMLQTVFVILATLSGGLPAIAESANFGTLSLAPGFPAAAGTATGYTSGSFSLSAIANRDRHNKLCLGYAGDQEVPDHVVVLQKNFARLSLKVSSKNKKTTLLVKGPDGTIRCGGVEIEEANWAAGTYRVWVGAPEAGMKQNYTFTARE